jgi:hypothetical protein
MGKQKIEDTKKYEASPKPASISFSLSPSSDSKSKYVSEFLLPDDLDEVRFFAGGGGRGIPLFCQTKDGTISGSSNVPQVEFTDYVETVFMAQSQFVISFKFPDGTVVPKYLTTNDEVTPTTEFPFRYTSMSFGYLIGLHSPPGLYTVSFLDEQQKMDCFFQVEKPSLPRIYSDSLSSYITSEFTVPNIVLINFQPFEQVCIFVYQSFHLITWHTVQVDEHGSLSLQLANISGSAEKFQNEQERPVFIAIGSDSGEVYEIKSKSLIGNIMTETPNYVETKDYAEAHNIYQEPSNTSPVIDTVAGRKSLRVIKKMVTNLGEVWWNIEADNGQQGWVHTTILASDSTGNSTACPKQ